MEVRLIYDAGCPNVDEARGNLHRAFAEIGIAPRWTELDNATLRAYASGSSYGSPTILVDGVDVAGAGPAQEPCCRLYHGPGDQLRGAPAVASIVAAIARAR